MKKIIHIVALFLIVTGCKKIIESPAINPIRFKASVENFTNNTKTAMDASKNIVWSKEDQLAIFLGYNVPDKYQITDEGVGTSSGVFEIITSFSGISTDIDKIVAFYPYAQNLSIKKKEITVNGDFSYPVYSIDGYSLPEVQTYACDSFGEETFPMVAITETTGDYTLNFRNVLGAIRLQLTGTQIVKSIKIEGKNNESLSGKVSIIIDPNTAMPILSFDDSVKSYVSLDCDDGVQLNEDTPTSFLISLPPVTFSDGFVITLTDSEDRIYTFASNAYNTIQRSSVLNMPVVSLNDITYKEGNVSVTEVSINPMILKLYYNGDVAQLILTTFPLEATIKNTMWTSDDAHIAMVSNTGEVTAISSGSTNIRVTVDGISALCEVIVSNDVIAEVDYIDEYGNNLGKGTVIDNVVWAPVNCGYHEIDYPYGKLYQWGRKYGLGFDEISSATIIEAPVSVLKGNTSNNANSFFAGYDFWHYPDNKLWNKGTDDIPLKAQYDPCPNGWRVPTRNELKTLVDGSYEWGILNGQNGLWFSGNDIQTLDNKIFLPAAGEISPRTCKATGLGDVGYYWSSSIPFDTEISVYYDKNDYAKKFRFQYKSNNFEIDEFVKGFGYSIRCVQDVNEIIDESRDDYLSQPLPQLGDYVDEYDINHGQGIEIDGVIWAPVNCGYHKTDYQWGKLYQFGRKYGQGYCPPYKNNDDSYIDDLIPKVISYNEFSKEAGSSFENCAIVFFNDGYDSWCESRLSSSWNSGNEEEPIKTSYDPCPEGWRVPTLKELNILVAGNSKWINYKNQNGMWFTGNRPLSSKKGIFLPASGSRGRTTDDEGNPQCAERNIQGRYMSSKASSHWNSTGEYFLLFDSNDINTIFNYTSKEAFAVRCVRE